MSKLRLLSETDDETNVLCLQWVSYISETTTQDVLVLIRTAARQTGRWVIYYAHSGI